MRRSPSPRQQQQTTPRALGPAETARPDGQEIAICAVPIDKAKLSPAGQFNGCTPQQIVPIELCLKQNDNDTSIGNPEAMTQTRGQLNFPPINPENQLQKVEDVNMGNVVNLIQNKAETTPDSVEVEAAPTMATPVTGEQSMAQEIVVLEAEDIPVETIDDKFRVICLTCGDVVTKFHYASHKANDCYSLARPPEARSTKDRQCDVFTSFPETATDRVAAIYRDALGKPNVNGTYNVNGKVGSLEDLKEYIWNLASKVRPDTKQ